MKKIMALFLLGICLCGLIGCGKNSVSETKIDYGSSKIYSHEDMDAAIIKIKDQLNTWKGCELHRIAYSSDNVCDSNCLSWLNELATAQELPGNFTQCIVFESDFNSSENGGEGFEPDSEYTGWEWWLAREDGGEWYLITWGY